MRLITGCYSKTIDPTLQGRGEGLTLHQVDLAAGTHRVLSQVPWVNPTFLCFNPDHTVVYATSEQHPADEPMIGAFAVEPDGLRLLSSRPIPGGDACHLVYLHDHVVVACYSTGSVVVYKTDSDGSLAKASGAVQHQGKSVNPDRQEGPHVHMICPWRDNLLFVVDLGIDQVRCYCLDRAQGELHAEPEWDMHLPAGAGPRHMALSEDGDTAFVFGELTGAIYVYRQGPDGFELEQEVDALPDSYRDTPSGSAIKLHPDGTKLFAAQRTADVVARCEWHPQDRSLEVLGFSGTRGKTPRDMTLSEDGNLLICCNQDSDKLSIFELDEKGRPSWQMDVPAPAVSCALIV